MRFGASSLVQTPQVQPSDDPDRIDDIVDEIMAEPLNGPPVDDGLEERSGDASPGPQVGERSPAAGSGPRAVRVKSREELEQEGVFGSRRPRMLAEPYVPTQQERDKHEKSHLPWRSWCPSCVGGGAVSELHHPAPEDPENS